MTSQQSALSSLSIISDTSVYEESIRLLFSRGATKEIRRITQRHTKITISSETCRERAGMKGRCRFCHREVEITRLESGKTVVTNGLYGTEHKCYRSRGDF